MIVYKVLKVRNKGLCSCIIDNPKWQRVYEIGKPTYPAEGTALMAFDSLEAALGFRNGPQVIFKAEAVHSRYHRENVVSWILLYKNDLIISFWKDRKCRRTCKVPEGTIFCSEITLLEQVG